MLRSLLMLMLMAAQLPVGGGVALYLCIHDDGAICGLVSSPESCDCRQTELSTCCDELASAASCCKPHSAPASPEAGLAPSPGCTHIPLGVGEKPPVFVERDAKSGDSTRLAHSIVCHTARPVVATASFASLTDRWQGPPAIPDFASSVVTTAVIRC